MTNSSEDARVMELIAGDYEAPSELVKALSDVDISKHLVDWLVEQGVKKWQAQLGLKLVSPLIVSAGKGTAKLMTDSMRESLLKRLGKYEWTTNVLNKLTHFTTKTSQKTTAEAQIEKLLEGPFDRSEMDVEHRKSLSRDLRIQLKLWEGLEDIKDELGQIREDLGDVFRFINPQPKFKGLLDPDIERNRFVFRSQYIPFVGRNTELESLTTFLNDDSSLLWSSIVGPGGVGKSRLALELCQRNGGAWRAGTLTNLDFDFSNWEPNQPTLIVIDYATQDEVKLKKVLTDLIHQKTEFSYFVRILLLERDNKSGSLEKISHNPDISQHQYGESLVLGQTGQEVAVGILEFFFHQNRKSIKKPTTWDKSLEKLKKIDSLMRPLFAAYYADAVARGGCGTECDRKSLLLDVIEREEEQFWIPNGVTEGDKALLALATISGGVTSRNTELPDCVTSIAEIIKKENLDHFKALNGSASKDEEGQPVQSIPPWEPDLVGELFVLQLLSDDEDTLTNDVRDTLMASAWSARPLNTAIFLDRLIEDYADHRTFRQLVKLPDTTNEKTAWLWSILAFNLSYYFGNANELATAQEYYAAIASLADAHPRSELIALEQARGAFNFVVILGKANKFETAQKYYAAIVSLVSVHPRNEDIALEQAKAAVNLTSYFSDANELEAAQEYYAAIASLVETHPLNEKIVLRQAKAALNLSGGFGDSNELEKAQEYYAAIVSLAAAHPRNEDVVFEQAKAAVNLIIDSLRNDTTHGVEKYIAEYKLVITTYQGHPEFLKTDKLADQYIREAVTTHSDPPQGTAKAILEMWEKSRA